MSDDTDYPSEDPDEIDCTEELSDELEDSGYQRGTELAHALIRAVERIRDDMDADFQEPGSLPFNHSLGHLLEGLGKGLADELMDIAAIGPQHLDLPLLKAVFEARSEWSEMIGQDSEDDAEEDGDGDETSGIQTLQEESQEALRERLHNCDMPHVAGMHQVADELHKVLKTVVSAITKTGIENGMNPDPLVIEGEILYATILALTERLRALPDIGIALAREVAEKSFEDSEAAERHLHSLSEAASGEAIARAMRRAAEGRRPRKR